MQGWNWLNEGKLANKPKWGFISTQVGAQLMLKASSEVVSLLRD